VARTTERHIGKRPGRYEQSCYTMEAILTVLEDSEVKEDFSSFLETVTVSSCVRIVVRVSAAAARQALEAAEAASAHHLFSHTHFIQY